MWCMCGVTKVLMSINQCSSSRAIRAILGNKNPVMLSVFALSSGLTLPSPVVHGGYAVRPALRVSLCALDESSARIEAAKRVVEVAGLFGDAQKDAAKVWVVEALAGDGADAKLLLEQQMDLFDECIIGEDDGAKCKELDQALSALEGELNAGSNSLDRAGALVRKAASKFGIDQEKAALLWTEHAKKNKASDPTLLLQSQFALFGECLLEDDGKSSRCLELQDAINALQESIGVGGMVVSTAGLMPKDTAQSTAEGPPPPEGFTWGGEF